MGIERSSVRDKRHSVKFTILQKATTRSIHRNKFHPIDVTSAQMWGEETNKKKWEFSPTWPHPFSPFASSEIEIGYTHLCFPFPYTILHIYPEYEFGCFHPCFVFTNICQLIHDSGNDPNPQSYSFF